MAYRKRPAFHVRHGWFFSRTDDGGVEVKVPDAGALTVDADTWASIVAAVCWEGENADTFQQALAFHTGGTHDLIGLLPGQTRAPRSREEAEAWEPAIPKEDGS